MADNMTSFMGSMMHHFGEACTFKTKSAVKIDVEHMEYRAWHQSLKMTYICRKHAPELLDEHASVSLA
eukprot:6478963-Amphidinium_carterae.3